MAQKEWKRAQRCGDTGLEIFKAETSDGIEFVQVNPVFFQLGESSIFMKALTGDTSVSIKQVQKLVVAFDINATIMEGDSMHGDADGFELTGPAKEVIGKSQGIDISGIKMHIVLYTFGKDFNKAVELLEAIGVKAPPLENYYLIARSMGDEIWAFPMDEDRGP